MAFSVHANFRGNNISSLDPDIWNASVAQVKQDILFAEAIDARLVVAHPGCCEPGHEEEAYDRLNRSLRELIPFARKRQIVFTLENMDGTVNKLFWRRQDVKRLLSLHPDLKLTIDFAHLGMTQQDISAFLNEFADRVAHFHISGYFPERPHTKVSLEETQIDFSPYLRGIRDWEMRIVIEISDRVGMRQSRAIIKNAFSG
jgi:sugar phosphate isomerase/epimerase